MLRKAFDFFNKFLVGNVQSNYRQQKGRDERRELLYAFSDSLHLPNICLPNTKVRIVKRNYFPAFA